MVIISIAGKSGCWIKSLKMKQMKIISLNIILDINVSRYTIQAKRLEK